MNPTETSSEDIPSDANLLRRTLSRVHWYAIGSAIAFGVTIGIVKVTPLFVGVASLLGLFPIAMNIVAVRRDNDLYSNLGTVVVIVGMLSLRSFFEMPWESGALAAVGTGFFLPFTLLWLCRRWVIQYCRLDELAIEPRE